MRKTIAVSLLCLSLLTPSAALTQDRVDTEINAKIRKEGMDNSQIMRTLHFLTDVYGPRLTGSPLYSEKLGNLALILWNVLNIGILVTFPLGYTQAREYAEMIWPLDILFLIIFILVGINV